MEEENWFFRLSAFEDRLLEYFETHPGFVTPETKRNEAYAFVKGGLRDISITRTSITWGVPVPWDDRHVFYVWYDALINYLSAIGYGRDDDEVAKWWPVSNHLIGKEIIRFHCVWWPAMCMAAGLEPVHHVHVNGWLLVGGEKLGKTMAAEGASSSPTSSPSASRKSSASIRSVTTCCARPPSATTASSRSRASLRATTRTLRTISATSSRASPPSSRQSARA